MSEQKIKELIKKYHLSYRKLALLLDISHGYLYDMLNGRRKMQKKYIIKIQNFFGGNDG